MSIEKVGSFPVVTESFKVFFVEPVGPVLALKDNSNDDFKLTFIFNYKGIRIDQAASWDVKRRKDGEKDRDKQEEKRDRAFDKMGQEQAESVVVPIIDKLFKGIEEDEEEDA